MILLVTLENGACLAHGWHDTVTVFDKHEEQVKNIKARDISQVNHEIIIKQGKFGITEVDTRKIL